MFVYGFVAQMFFKPIFRLPVSDWDVFSSVDILPGFRRCTRLCSLGAFSDEGLSTSNNRNLLPTNPLLLLYLLLSIPLHIHFQLLPFHRKHSYGSIFPH